jgi:hypothetical protein
MRHGGYPPTVVVAKGKDEELQSPDMITTSSSAYPLKQSQDAMPHRALCGCISCTLNNAALHHESI